MRPFGCLKSQWNNYSQIGREIFRQNLCIVPSSSWWQKEAVTARWLIVVAHPYATQVLFRMLNVRLIADRESVFRIKKKTEN